MDELDILSFRPRSWSVVIMPPSSTGRILIAAALWAEHAPLTVFDCGRRYDASVVGVAAGGRQEVADRIQSRRAFTCDQATKLLEKADYKTNPVLILVLDLLNSFRDENVKLSLRRFLFNECMKHIRRLSSGPGLVVAVCKPPEHSDALPFFDEITAKAPSLVTIKQYVAPSTPRLF